MSTTYPATTDQTATHPAATHPAATDPANLHPSAGEADQPGHRISWPWLGAWALLAVFVGFEVVKHGFVNGSIADAALYVGVAFGFFIAPDLTFVIGIGDDVPKGHLSRRAVPFYNAMHRMRVPLALAGVVGIGMAPLTTGPLAIFIGSLSWMAHIALDRAAGYGLRNADGSR